MIHHHLSIWTQIMAAPIHDLMRNVGWFISFCEWAGDYSHAIITFTLLFIQLCFIGGVKDSLMIIFKKSFTFTKLHSKIAYRRYSFNLKLLKSSTHSLLLKVNSFLTNLR